MSPVLIGIVCLIAYRYYKHRQSVAAGANPGESAKSFNPTIISVALNAVTTISGLFHLFTQNQTARFWSIAASVVNSVYIVYMNYGLPKMTRSNMMGPFREWVAKAMSGAEFPFLFFSLIFLNAIATTLMGSVLPFGIGEFLAFLVILRRSIWFIGNHGSKFWAATTIWAKYGSLIWSSLKYQEPMIMHIAVVSEIFIGFWFIVLLFTPARQLMNLFVYWNYLRIRYMSPRSRPGHAAVWIQLDDFTHGIRKSFPVLEKPIQIAVDWFNGGQRS